MVRGRKVRALVAYDDCCSPNPKRKDQRIDVGCKPERNLVAPNNAQTITRFFQAVGVDIDYPKSILSLPESDGAVQAARLIDSNVESIVDIKELAYSETEMHGFDRTHAFKKETPPSPSTPHRIELCTYVDGSRSVNANDEQVVPAPKTKAVCRTVNFGRTEKTAAAATNHKLTEYFPVRRSARKTKKTVLEERQRSLERAVRGEAEDGLEVHCFAGKGRGVVTTRVFHKGDFVVEYSGELVDLNEARLREQRYAEDQNAGCYMYYFKHKNQQYCIDATAETGRLGRLVNHSRNGNLVTRTVMVDDKPRLVLLAKNSISAGEEVTYDYGDRSKESLKHHPWLAL